LERLLLLGLLKASLLGLEPRLLGLLKARRLWSLLKARGWLRLLLKARLLRLLLKARLLRLLLESRLLRLLLWLKSRRLGLEAHLLLLRLLLLESRLLLLLHLPRIPCALRLHSRPSKTRLLRSESRGLLGLEGLLAERLLLLAVLRRARAAAVAAHEGGRT
jgi:hypothetical protein